MFPRQAQEIGEIDAILGKWGTDGYRLWIFKGKNSVEMAMTWGIQNLLSPSNIENWAVEYGRNISRKGGVDGSWQLR